MDFISIVGHFAVVLILLGSVTATMVSLPGNWILLLATIGYAYLTEFKALTLPTVLMLSGAILVGELIEFVAALMGAKKQRASRWTMAGTIFGGLIGAMLGTMVLPLIGSIIGAAAGVFAVAYGIERYVSGNDEQATKVAKGALIGQLIGMLSKLCIAIGVAFVVFVHMVRYLGF